MVILSSSQTNFPPVDDADENGLVAIGGDLSTDRLLSAYKQGIFPWYNEDELIQWWSPNPRFVLFPQDLKISSSMKAVIKSNKFTFCYNTAFLSVIENCKQAKRNNQNGTWIGPDIIKAYSNLHNKRFAVSAEAWQRNELVGGLYGVRLGNVFFGESMFSNITNASKFAFIKYVEQLKKEGVVIIDCQVYTSHLESLGAVFINRSDFINILTQNT